MWQIEICLIQIYRIWIKWQSFYQYLFFKFRYFIFKMTDYDFIIVICQILEQLLRTFEVFFFTRALLHALDHASPFGIPSKKICLSEFLNFFWLKSGHVLGTSADTKSHGPTPPTPPHNSITPLHLVFQARKNVRLNFSTFSGSKVVMY